MNNQDETTEFAILRQTRVYSYGLRVTQKTRTILGTLIWLDPDPVRDLLSRTPVTTAFDLNNMCKRYPNGRVAFYKKQLDGLCELAREPEILFGLDVTHEQLQSLLPVLYQSRKELLEWEGTPDEGDLQILGEIERHCNFLQEVVHAEVTLATARNQHNNHANVSDHVEKWLAYQSELVADIDKNKDIAKHILSRLASQLPNGVHNVKAYSTDLQEETRLALLKKTGLVTCVDSSTNSAFLLIQEDCDNNISKLVLEVWELLEEKHIVITDEDTVTSSFVNTLAAAYARTGTLRVVSKASGTLTDTSIYVCGYSLTNGNLSVLSKDELFWFYIKNADSQNIKSPEHIVCQLAPELGI